MIQFFLIIFWLYIILSRGWQWSRRDVMARRNGTASELPSLLNLLLPVLLQTVKYILNNF